MGLVLVVEDEVDLNNLIRDQLVGAGHEVVIETGAGNGIGVDDAQYRAAGASIAARAADVFGRAELIVKVKEPQPLECEMLRPGQVLFTYLHLAADPAQAHGLMKSGATAIAYETVTAPNGSLPLLTPMSEVAGRMSIQVGAACLQKANGGFGVLLGGVPGVPPAKIVVLGGGVAGTNATEIAVGMRADVTVVDRSVDRLRQLSALFGPALRTAYSTTETIERLVCDADLVVGAVLVAGAASPGYRRRVAGDSHAAAAVQREDGDRVGSGLGGTDLQCAGFRRTGVAAAGRPGNLG